MSKLEKAVKALNGDVRLGELNGGSKYVADLRTVLSALATYQSAAEAARAAITNSGRPGIPYALQYEDAEKLCAALADVAKMEGE